VGANWGNYGEGAFSLASALGMLIFDFFLYGVLAWYFDKVLPRQFGAPLHPLFCLRCKACSGGAARSRARWWRWPWCGCKRRASSSGAAAVFGEEEHQALARAGSGGGGGATAAALQERSGNFEAVPAEVASKGGVQLVGLSKRYGDKWALSGVSLSLYEGQITCYLGHNGAGKSTTIGACTGEGKKSELLNLRKFDVHTFKI
jgi:ABC-type multidrug transport system fused ATPase/permease subunit